MATISVTFSKYNNAGITVLSSHSAFSSSSTSLGSIASAAHCSTVTARKDVLVVRANNADLEELKATIARRKVLKGLIAAGSVFAAAGSGLAMVAPSPTNPAAKSSRISKKDGDVLNCKVRDASIRDSPSRNDGTESKVSQLQHACSGGLEGLQGGSVQFEGGEDNASKSHQPEEERFEKKTGGGLATNSSWRTLQQMYAEQLMVTPRTEANSRKLYLM